MAQQLSQLCSKDHRRYTWKIISLVCGCGCAATFRGRFFAGAVNEDREQTSGIIKLLTTNKPEAVRVVQRLHPNLGHPEPQRLVELLQGASSEVLDAAENYHCVACQRYRRPNATAPAQLPDHPPE